MTRINEILSSDVQWVKPDTDVVRISRLMAENDCGFIPVGDNDKLVGIVTDRDIVLRCIAKDMDPIIMQAKDVMTPEVFYCYDHHTVEDVAKDMANNKVRRMPVVNKNKNLVGVISLGDLSQVQNKEEACGHAMSRIAA